MYLLAEGSKFLFSSSFGSAVAATTVTNGDPAAITAAAHGFSAADELLFDSGWEDATDSIWKVAPAPSTNNLSLLALDSSDQQWFPNGTGVGTLRKVSNWIEIGQVLDVQPSGGGTRNVDINPLSKRNGIKMPAGFEASGMDLTLGYDPSLASQIALNKLTRNLSSKIGFKFLMNGGQTGYGYGTAQLAQMPNIAKGSAVSVKLSLSFRGQFVGYPS